jgi:hypothetical protein
MQGRRGPSLGSSAKIIGPIPEPTYSVLSFDDCSLLSERGGDWALTFKSELLLKCSRPLG